MSSAASRAIADRLGNAQQDGTVIRFEIEPISGYSPIAVFHEASLSWSIAGLDRAWGNRLELAEKFGDFEVIWSPNAAWQTAQVSGNPNAEENARILADVRIVLEEAVVELDGTGNDIEYVAMSGLVANLQAISGLESEPTYVKCARCPMFVEDNPDHQTDSTLAQFVHLMNDDRVLDVIYDEDHDAEPDINHGPHTLAWWAKNGDVEWQRFDKYAKNPASIR